MRRTSVNFFAIRNFESPLSAFLRVRVCVLTIVIPDDLEHAPTCDSPGEISARSVHFAVR
jgi:hypothetical protein